MRPKRPNIYVVGSFVMGLTIQVPRMPVTGETLIGKNFDFGPGGKGVNQAIAAARAGGKVKMSVCIGNDLFGKLAFDMLKKEKLMSGSVRRVQGAVTGCGFVTLLDDGDNSIIIDPGANLRLTSEMIEEDEEDIKNSHVVMAQLEVLDGPVETAMRLGRENSAITILNPAPARKIPLSVLKYVDVLTPNETEAKILLDLPLDSNIPVAELGEKLLDLGVKTVIITCGKKGAMITDLSGSLQVSAPKIKPVDPTGAGDCFNGNLAIGLARGLSVKKAVERAIFAGAFCAQKLGVLNGLPKTKELDAYIDKLETL